MKYTDFRKTLDLEEKKAFDSEEELAFEISEMVEDARVYQGLTQEKLAEKLDTQQSSVARLENGKSLPSLKFLLRVARALNTKLIPPKFELVLRVRSESQEAETQSFSQEAVASEQINLINHQFLASSSQYISYFNQG